jgi:hypothetical protein
MTALNDNMTKMMDMLIAKNINTEYSPIATEKVSS